MKRLTAQILITRLRRRGVELDFDYDPENAGIDIYDTDFVRPHERRAFRRLRDDVRRLLDTEKSNPFAGWPEKIKASRHVVEYAPCADCLTDPPPDEVIRAGRKRVAVPGQTGTRVAYGSTPLCLRHALKRA